MIHVNSDIIRASSGTSEIHHNAPDPTQKFKKLLFLSLSLHTCFSQFPHFKFPPTNFNGYISLSLSPFSFASLSTQTLNTLSLTLTVYHFHFLSVKSTSIRAHNEALYATAKRDLEGSAFHGTFVVAEP
jgi:hypothetical protein